MAAGLVVCFSTSIPAWEGCPLFTVGAWGWGPQSPPVSAVRGPHWQGVLGDALPGQLIPGGAGRHTGYFLGTAGEVKIDLTQVLLSEM